MRACTMQPHMPVRSDTWVLYPVPLAATCANISIAGTCDRHLEEEWRYIGSSSAPVRRAGTDHIPCVPSDHTPGYCAPL